MIFKFTYKLEATDAPTLYHILCIHVKLWLNSPFPC